MPRSYEDMRNAFMRGDKKHKPMKKKAAQKKAARIYNSKHPANPVGGKRKDIEYYKKHGFLG